MGGITQTRKCCPAIVVTSARRYVRCQSDRGKSRFTYTHDVMFQFNQVIIGFRDSPQIRTVDSPNFILILVYTHTHTRTQTAMSMIRSAIPRLSRTYRPAAALHTSVVRNKTVTETVKDTAASVRPIFVSQYHPLLFIEAHHSSLDPPTPLSLARRENR